MRSSAPVPSLHLAALLLGVTTSLAAQQMKGPPPYLQIFQEEVRIGRTGAHPAAEAGWPRAFAKAKIANHYIGMTTVYGPDEAWFCAGVRSIAEIEQQNQAMEKTPGLMRELDRLAQADASNVSNHRSLLGRYHAELSNGAEINPAEMRYWEALVFRIRPGHEADFAQAVNLYRSTVASAKATLSWATYEVMAGMPGPVFIIFVPHKALAEIDPATGAMAAVEKAMNEETMKKFGTLFEGFNSVENLIFAVSPEMSYPVPEWVAQDPEFWGRKPTAARDAAPTKPGS